MSRDDLVSLVHRLAPLVEARQRFVLRMRDVSGPITRQQLIQILEACVDYFYESMLDTPAGQEWVEIPDWVEATKRLCAALNDLRHGTVDPLLQRNKSNGRPMKPTWAREHERFIGVSCEILSQQKPRLKRTAVTRTVAATLNQKPACARRWTAGQVDRCWKLYRNPRGRKK